ncbi:MAG: hypothetical protein LC785_00295 [Acidobacteria bacterium]|nr:hypothetical protein [Acidobacteriota bacterium]
MRRNCLLRFLAATLCAVVFSSAVAAAQAQEPPVKPAPAGTDEARIVAQLVAKETAFQRAFAGYSFEREAIIQSIGMGRQVTGEYFRRSRISFDPQGVMRERVIKMPVPGLAPSQTDIDDLNTIQLFVLEEVFPTFDYYREHDGRSWLPSTVFADDELELKSGAVVRVRIRVKYRDYDSTGARQ